MRIISWNCRYGEFHAKKKDAAILAFQPDVLIVPECDRLESMSARTMPNLTGCHWIGRTNECFSIGLGVFTFGDYHLEVLECFDPEIQWIVPYKITNGKSELILLAVWTVQQDEVLEQRELSASNWTVHQRAIHYVERTWKALQRYEHLLSRENVLLMGDFNSTCKKLSTSQAVEIEGVHVDHAKIVEFLERRKIRSVYHVDPPMRQGDEREQATHYWTGGGTKDLPYHIDFCFASESMLNRKNSITIGEYDKWRKYSDHMPLIADFEM